MPLNAEELRHAIVGSLLGTAVGDALGLPCEGLNKRRQARIYPALDGHRFFFGKGMFSDDTEHTAMVAQALLVAGGDVSRFEDSLAWRFRLWLLGIPAGIGFATLRAIIKLWFGFGLQRSGVFSAGNGPAMRSAIVGAAYADTLETIAALVRASTRITHTDDKAYEGALFVAVAAALATQDQGAGNITPNSFVECLSHFRSEELTNTETEFMAAINCIAESVNRQESTEEFAVALGLENGVSGYVLHTVPIALHAWLSHQTDYASAVLSVIRCGGDTDTSAAIVGGIVGAGVGPKGIPDKWLDDLIDWPRSRSWLERLGDALAKAVEQGVPAKNISLLVPALLIRNVFFIIIVLFHGFRRILPPY